MTDVERVWRRIKITAQRAAAEKRRLGHDGALDLVVRIVSEESAENPPPEAVEYLTNELLALAKQFEGAGTGARSA